MLLHLLLGIKARDYYRFPEHTNAGNTSMINIHINQYK